MNDILAFKIFENIIVFFETFIIYQYLEGLFEKKISTIRALTLYLIFCIGLITLTLSIQMGLPLILYTVFGVYLLSAIIYKTKLTTRVISLFFFVILMMLSELIAPRIISGIWHLPLSDLTTYSLNRCICMLVTKLLQLLLVKITVTLVQWKTYTSHEENYKMILPLFVCQIISIIFTQYIFVISTEIHHQFTFLTLCTLVGIVYINVLIFWYFDRIKTSYEYKAKSEAAEHKLALEKQYHSILLEHQRETDALWHDMKKHLRLIKSLITEENQALSTQYIRELESNMNRQVKPVHTNEPILSALLSEQSRRAQKNNLPIDFDVKLEGSIKISPVDLCIILDNLFDNALEACTLQANSNQEASIKILVKQKSNALLIRFINTYSSETRSHWHTGKHGLGLENVKTTVKKYDGQLSIKEDKQLFTVTILIP